MFLFYFIINYLIKNLLINCSDSEVRLAIQGNNYKKVLNKDFCNKFTPSEIIINDEKQSRVNCLPDNLQSGINNITLKWNYQITDCSEMFYELKNLKSIDFSDFDASIVTSMKNMFYLCESLESINFGNIDTSNLINMDFMFHKCTSLKSLDLNNLDTSNVISMSKMFHECTSLKSLDLNNLDTSKVSNMSAMFQKCKSLETLDLSQFDTSNVTDMNLMFSECIDLKSINLDNFDTKNVNYMNCMFNMCYNLSSLNIMSFDTSNVLNMQSMFNDCGSLTSLNLNNFNTSKVTNFRAMFNNCGSLISLNVYNFEFNDMNSFSNFFVKMNADFKYCINNLTASTVSLGYNCNCEIVCNQYPYYICFEKTCPTNFGNIIEEKKVCIVDCSLDDIYIYVYNNKCYRFPLFTIDIIRNLNDIHKELYVFNKNKTISLNDTQIDIIIENLGYILTEINSDTIISKLKEGQDILFLENNNINISLVLTENEKNNRNKNVTAVILGECEINLKEKYNISMNKSLLIYKIDVRKDNMKIPTIEYKVYYPLNGKQLKELNLTYCEGNDIDIHIPVIFNSQKEKDKHNISSKYYSDICYKETSEKGTDIILKDRKDYYIDNELNTCEEKCRFTEYIKKIKKAVCSCPAKTSFKLFSEIGKKKDFISGLKDIKNLVNLNVMKCYYTLFTNDGISKNFAFYFVLSGIIFYFISTLIFYKKDNHIIKYQIKGIVNAIITPNIKSENKIKIIKFEKTNVEKKKFKRPNNSRKSTNATPTVNVSQNISKMNENSKDSINLEPNEKKNSNLVIKYNIYELNNLPYKEALLLDKRTYFQFYISLIKIKHLIFFTFCNLKDYNSKIIKYLLFCISFIIFFAVNALFFNDITMHKIYKHGGSYSLLYQLPQILYSLMISAILNLIIKTLALSEKNILQLKAIKNKKIITEISRIIIKKLFYKFLFFFIISFLFLVFFWYYLSSFCAVYENTQSYLIKDTLISFGLNMIFPFGLYLIPGLFRIPSLRSNKREKIYKFSKIIQLI